MYNPSSFAKTVQTFSMSVVQKYLIHLIYLSGFLFLSFTFYSAEEHFGSIYDSETEHQLNRIMPDFFNHF